ncbi:hypothetical protein N9O33_04615 [Gammaproteobacteria bacterium]|nr:hypothetical protein [Gammaproteobacteria bacterium]
MNKPIIPQISRWVGYILILGWVALGGIFYEAGLYEELGLFSLLSIAFGYWIYLIYNLNNDMKTAKRAVTLNRRLIVKLMMRNYEGSHEEKVEQLLDDINDLDDLIPEEIDPDLFRYYLNKDIKSHANKDDGI